MHRCHRTASCPTNVWRTKQRKTVQTNPTRPSLDEDAVTTGAAFSSHKKPVSTPPGSFKLGPRCGHEEGSKSLTWSPAGTYMDGSFDWGEYGVNVCNWFNWSSVTPLTPIFRDENIHPIPSNAHSAQSQVSNSVSIWAGPVRQIAGCIGWKFSSTPWKLVQRANHHPRPWKRFPYPTTNINLFGGGLKNTIEFIAPYGTTVVFLSPKLFYTTKPGQPIFLMDKLRMSEFRPAYCA